ncbi:hypothetical protein BK010_09120 [Tenericutes bacterium MO-XQ]|nr:hypothetical protein BK010_09120 [Tenericutes bacterium MO-XQ]
MKKRILIIVIITAALSIAGLMIIPKMIEKDTVNDINRYSEFGIELLYQLSDEDWDNYNVSPGFGMDIIYDKALPRPFEGDSFFDIHEYSETNPVVFYDITSYPNIIGDYGYVTRIETTDPDHHLFGLKVNDQVSEDEISEALNEYHYGLDEVYDHGDLVIYEYKRSKVTIDIYTENDVITRFRIRIKVRSIPGIVF